MRAVNVDQYDSKMAIGPLKVPVVVRSYSRNRDGASYGIMLDLDLFLPFNTSSLGNFMVGLIRSIYKVSTE